MEKVAGVAISASSSRREGLVGAAFRRISEQGLEGLRLRAVATEAGIDHSTLHHYFATKQHLLAAVVEYSARQFWATMPAEGTAAQRLSGHLGALGRLIGERPALFVVLAEFDLRGRRGDTVAAALERQEAGWRNALTTVLSDSGGDHPPAAEQVQATVEVVIATVKGVRLLPERAAPVLRRLHQLIAADLSAPAPSPPRPEP